MMMVRSMSKVRPHGFGGGVRVQGIVITGQTSLVQSIHPYVGKESYHDSNQGVQQLFRIENCAAGSHEEGCVSTG